jgi:hypothetical protein
MNKGFFLLLYILTIIPTLEPYSISTKTKKIIGGIAGAAAGIVLIAGGIYYKKYTQQKKNSLRKPLLTDDVIFDECSYDQTKSKELILLLKNGQGTDSTIINSIDTYIKAGANPNGTDNASTIHIALENKRSEQVISALLNNGAKVTNEIINFAHLKNVNPNIITLLENNCFSVPIYSQSELSNAECYAVLLSDQNNE